MKYKAIVIGVSSGGLEAIKTLFSALPANFSIPIVVVQHMGARSDGMWIPILQKNFPLRFKEADEKEKLKPKTIYIAPPNYHLMIEKDGSFSLSVAEKLNFARPSIDVLFETAAIAYKEHLVGIVLTGSNSDGAAGLKSIKECGGLCIVQDPKTAASPYMPQAAISAVTPDHILNLYEIIDLLKVLNLQNTNNEFYH